QTTENILHIYDLILILTCGAVIAQAQCSSFAGCCREMWIAGPNCQFGGQPNGRCQVEDCGRGPYWGAVSCPAPGATLTCVPEYELGTLSYCPEVYAAPGC